MGAGGIPLQTTKEDNRRSVSSLHNKSSERINKAYKSEVEIKIKSESDQTGNKEDNVC